MNVQAIAVTVATVGGGGLPPYKEKGRRRLSGGMAAGLVRRPRTGSQVLAQGCPRDAQTLRGLGFVAAAFLHDGADVEAHGRLKVVGECPCGRGGFARFLKEALRMPSEALGGGEARAFQQESQFLLVAREVIPLKRR